MPIETPLSGAPAFDDYDAKKDFYRMVYRPGLPVQTRELNQQQTYHQVQIERFADGIYKQGTISAGCNFNFAPAYAYAKIEDLEVDGQTAIPESYVGLFARSGNNVTSYVVNSVDGFESNSPDLKTLYFHYTNSGDDGNTSQYSPGDILTIYNSENSLFGANVDNGGTAFSNSDAVIFTPAVILTVTSGTFSNGQYITNDLTGANLQIISIDANTLSSLSQVILQLKPRVTDLANVEANSAMWTVTNDDPLRNIGNTASGYVAGIIGTDAQARITTNGVGNIKTVTFINRGNGYLRLPYVSVRSPNNSAGLTALSITVKDYFAKVKVANEANAVGQGYAFSVGEGEIYQKGHFLRVDPQTVIVDKYSPSPNNVCVGFRTEESIIDSNQDTSLLDNALGSENYTAPGANRLKLVPKLVVLDIDAARANGSFFSLVEWSDGQAYKQNQVSAYSRLGDEMAQRTFDESGNYVIDTFQVTSVSTANGQNEGGYYTAVIDPGQAYINGYKVQTLRNYYIDVAKGTDTRTVNSTVSFNYGNYIRVNNMGGLFQFSTGDTVDVYDTVKGFLANTTLISTGNTNPLGTKIGTARMRSLVLESGTIGDSNCTYRMYLFDIRMNTGKNFKNARALYYNGTNKGIADIVLDYDVSSNTTIAKLNDIGSDALVFNSGFESVKNSNNATYVYRTIDQTTAFSNNGTLTKSIAASPNEFYPYSGDLSTSQLQTLHVVPLANNLIQYTPFSGNVTCVSSSANVTGGTSFIDQYDSGDYIYLYHDSDGVLVATRRVLTVSNNTHMVLDAPTGISNTAISHKRIFPKNVPIPFGVRPGLSANVDANSNVLVLTLAHANGTAITIDASGTTNTALAVNIQRTGVTSAAKSAVRNRFVKISLANNAANTTQGPWALGVPDIFRLRNVYVGSNSSVNSSSVNVTPDFYIDHNQTPNFMDNGWLYLQPQSGLSIANTDWLLVEFDHLTRDSTGYYDTVSYTHSSNTTVIEALNSTRLADLTTAVASLEVPEVYTSRGTYYDLLNCFDFRPVVDATVTPASSAALAPVNPANSLSFGNTADPSNDNKFPLPDSSATMTVEHYLGRIDSVFIAGDKGNIYVLKGIPDADPRKRYPANHPKDSLRLQSMTVPPYPNITETISQDVIDILRTGVANERVTNQRLRSHVIKPILSSLEFQLSQPMVYTMEDIANLERRIKDLEYYVSLSILETSITNKTIPSSIDPSINRFKYGFFADDASTENYSDLDNPQYAASIEVEGTEDFGTSKSPLDTETNWADSDKSTPMSVVLTPAKLIQKKTNRFVPPKFIYSLNHTVENLGYIDEEIINQINATDTTPVSNCIPYTGNDVVQNVTSNTVIINGSFYTEYDGISRTNLIDSITFNTSNVAGTIALSFEHYSDFNKIDVYQGTTLRVSSNATANAVVNLSTAEKSFLTTNATAKVWFNLGASRGQTTTLEAFGRSGDKVNHGGKISWTHVPSSGTEYTIKVTRNAPASNYKYFITYPLALSTSNTVTAQSLINVQPCKPEPLQVYTGTMVIPRQETWAWACSKLFRINGITTLYLVISCTGLKPLTKHEFYVDSEIQTSFCKLYNNSFSYENNYNGISSIGGASAETLLAALKLAVSGIGQGLYTTAQGWCQFVYYAPIAGGQGYNWLKAVYNNRSATYGSSGYSTFELKAPQSSAKKLVAARSAATALPPDPAGNP